MDVFNYYNYTLLKDSKDQTIAAIAAKSIKEATYHLKRSSEWIVRLGDGTEESNEKIQACINELWMYVDEFFETDEVHDRLVAAGIAADITKVKVSWNKKVSEILETATLKKPELPKYSLVYGKDGGHTDYMGYILTEMQFLKNRFPKEVW